MAFRVELKLEDLPPALQGGAFARVVQQEAIRAVNEVMGTVNNRMKSISQFGGTNQLLLAWQVTKAFVRSDGSVEGRSGNKTVQASVIDEGARRHRPPVGALNVWVRSVLGISDPGKIKRVAFLIGKKISQRGLPGRLSQKGKFTRMFRSLGGVIAIRLRDMQTRIARRIG